MARIQQQQHVDFVKRYRCCLLLGLIFLASGCVAHTAAKPQPADPEADARQRMALAAELSTHPTPFHDVALEIPTPPPAETASTEQEPVAHSAAFDPDEDFPSFSSDHLEPMPSVSEIVLEQYDEWRGVRYRPGGTDYRGVDCSGLVRAIFKEAFQVDLPRSSVDQAKMGESVPRDEIQPGDLVYFIDRGRKHVGVAVNKKEFVHASRKKGVILSSLDKYWASRLLRVRRLL